MRRYFAAIDAEEYATAGAMYAPDGQLSGPGLPTHVGPAGVEAYLRRVLAPWAEHVDAPTRILTAGATTLVEVRFTGRLASGDQLAFDAVDVVDFDAHGRIRRLTSWFDSAWLGARVRRALAPRVR